MLSRTSINQMLTLVFLVLVGFSLGKSIQTGSWLGLGLSITSLGAAVYFLYLLVNMKKEMEAEEKS